jgi:hypothetical protein
MFFVRVIAEGRREEAYHDVDWELGIAEGGREKYRCPMCHGEKDTLHVLLNYTDTRE